MVRIITFNLNAYVTTDMNSQIKIIRITLAFLVPSKKEPNIYLGTAVMKSINASLSMTIMAIMKKTPKLDYIIECFGTFIKGGISTCVTNNRKSSIIMNADCAKT